MRTRKSKEEFINYMKKRIEIRKTIMDFVENIYFPLMCTKYDGKVYNIRFIKELREAAEKMNELMYVKERDYDHIEIQLRGDKYNYTDYQSIYVKCNLTSDGRIDYESTVNDKMGKDWIENFRKYADEYQMSIDNYDTYMAKAEEMEKLIKEYNKLPYPFRGNIDTSSWQVY